MKIRGVLAPQSHELIVRQSKRVAERRQMLLDKPGIETVVSGRHWGVRCENNLAADAGGSLLEADSFILHATAHRLQHRKRAMALIEVEHRWRDAHRAERTDAAHPKQQLLTNPYARVSLIQARGQLAILRSVAENIRIQQK